MRKISTTKDIIKYAKYILFPINESDKFKDYSEYKIIPNKIYRLPLFSDKNSLMLNYPLNRHHYKLAYTYNYVLPLIARLFNIPYDRNDFNIVKNIVTDNGVTIDLSYLIPKGPCNYTVKSLEFDTSYKITNFDFRPKKEFIEKLSKSGSITEYHKLVPFPHSPFILINHNSKTKRKLFISGDSHMIPSLIPLSAYYREIWYYDNRTKPHIYYKKTYVYKEFDDILIELWKNPLNKYIKDNIN